MFFWNWLVVLQLLKFVIGHSLNIPNSGLPEKSKLHPLHITLTPWARQNKAEDSEHWFQSAQQHLSNKLTHVHIERKAKNLILYVGDGMSLSTVTASRIFKGQREGLEFGEEAELYMDRFPYTGASKTYCSDWQVADSACSSTAYSCGTKANAGTIGVTPTVTRNNCTLQMDPKNHVSSILSWAQANGMSTGIVTTTEVTEASPSGSYAHVANREFQSDSDVEESGYDPEICHDIAKQLIQESPGSGINVILGGGRANFIPSTMQDPEHKNITGRRKDGHNYPVEWLQDKANAKYVITRDELLNIDLENTDYLLGLFAPEALAYLDQREANNDPSLVEMTEVAIKILSKNPNGFYLFVEGGRIDQAHHANQAQRALAETLEYDNAIKLGDEMTDDEDTLIVVTSDHSHLFTIAGDPQRGNPILGFTGNTDNLDKLPATTLSYVNGLGYREPTLDLATGKCVRADLTNEDVENIEFRQPSLYPRSSATHAGEDVLIFAKGPFAHLFTGVNEQSFIPHAMAYAACISPFENNYCTNFK